MQTGFRHIRGYFKDPQQLELIEAIRQIIAQAPLFHPTMPRTGKPFSVQMTNAGTLGWVSDISGYRYQDRHPETAEPWPPLPAMLSTLWRDVADWPGDPEACLINYYGRGTRMGSHVDRDENDFSAPVVSVSLGDDAVFHVGGLRRSDPKTRIVLRSGDVAVLGGSARKAYHGIDRIIPGSSDLLTEGGRFNLTLRRVTTYQNPVPDLDRTHGT